MWGGRRMKLIDILNKIANEELKQNTQIIWNDTEYILRDGIFLRYIDFPNARIFLLEDKAEKYRKDSEWLNDEVELIVPNDFADDGKMIEPTDNTKIEELDMNLITEGITCNHFQILATNKINEVIRYINK